MDITTINNWNNKVPISNIIGTSLSNEVIDQINSSIGSYNQVIGSANDPYMKINNEFINQVITPVRQAQDRIISIKNEIKDFSNEFMALTSPQNFIIIPPVMRIPIVSYTPVKKLLKQGRIGGYGYEYEDLEEGKSQFERQAFNGFKEVTEETLNPDGSLDLEYEWRSEDMYMTFEEQNNLLETFLAIDNLIDQGKDPTSSTDGELDDIL